MTAFQHPNPGFLEHILGEFAIAGADKSGNAADGADTARLNDRAGRDRAAKTTGDHARLGLHAIHEITSRGVHATGYTVEGRKKMQASCAI